MKKEEKIILNVKYPYKGITSITHITLERAQRIVSTGNDEDVLINLLSSLLMNID